MKQMEMQKLFPEFNNKMGRFIFGRKFTQLIAVSTLS